MNFSLHVYVTGQEAERANKDDDRPGAPAAAQEEGRPRPLRLNDRPSGRGEIAGIGYETGRPSLPRLCQAFFPSDTEVGHLFFFAVVGCLHGVSVSFRRLADV